MPLTAVMWLNGRHTLPPQVEGRSAKHVVSGMVRLYWRLIYGTCVSLTECGNMQEPHANVESEMSVYYRASRRDIVDKVLGIHENLGISDRVLRFPNIKIGWRVESQALVRTCAFQADARLARRGPVRHRRELGVSIPIKVC